jgi:hypothetical protein
MSSFSVNPHALKSDARIMSACALSLNNDYHWLRSVMDTRVCSGPAYGLILQQLEAIAQHINAEHYKLLGHSDALWSIADQYENCENEIIRSRVKEPHNDPSQKENVIWLREGSISTFLQELSQALGFSLELMKLLKGLLLSRGDEEIKEALAELLEKIKADQISDINAAIPSYLSNDGFVELYRALGSGDAKGNPVLEGLLRFFANNMTEEEMAANYASNLNNLDSVYTPGTFIENQPSWGNICYGKNSEYPIFANFANVSNMANSGCGVIAVANAFHNMGHDLSKEEMAQLITDFEKNGMIMNGCMGTSPAAMYEYMTDHGYETDYTTSNDPAVINDFSNDYDTFLVMAYNNQQNINYSAHHFCITKDADGNFVVHNGEGNGLPSAPFSSLDKAIKNMGSADPRSVIITGVKP